MKLRSGKTYSYVAPKKKVVKITKKVRVRPMKVQAQAQVTTLVKKMIAKNLENKEVGFAIETNITHNSPIGAADAIPLVQQIPQVTFAPGVDTAQLRMGDRIKPKSLVIKGVIATRPDVGSIQNLLVRVMVLSQKTIKLGSQIVAGGFNFGTLTKPGFIGAGSSELPFDGTTNAISFPVNTDEFRVYYDRTHLLAPSIPGPNGCAMPVASKRWSYRFKQLPTALTFDDDSADWCNNFAPFVVIGYAYADGTSPDLINGKIRSNIMSYLQFEDA